MPGVVRGNARQLALGLMAVIKNEESFFFFFSSFFSCSSLRKHPGLEPCSQDR